VVFSVSCFRIRFLPKHSSTETMQVCNRDSAALQWRLWHFLTVLANSRLSVGAPCTQKAGTDRERKTAYHVPRNVSDSSDNQRMGKILRSIYRHVILHQFYTKFAKFVNLVSMFRLSLPFASWSEDPKIRISGDLKLRLHKSKYQMIRGIFSS
jgi:hypothetical protein